MSTDNIGLVTNFIDSQDFRAFINPGWLELFPNKDNRPARKTTSFPLPEGIGVELQAFGVQNQRRTCIEVKGLTHRDPLPNAARLGDYVFSSVIVPWDLATSEPVIGEAAQTDQAFLNMKTLMEEAGATIDDVVLQWVYLNDFAYQPYMVDVYLEAWPIDQYQAARKTFRYPMGGQIQIQCIGRIGGERSNHEIPGPWAPRSDSDGRAHRRPVRLLWRLGCRSFERQTSSSPSRAPQARPTSASATCAPSPSRAACPPTTSATSPCCSRITPTCRAVDKEWCEMFPDPANRPARQIMQMGLQRRSRVQYHMLAAV